MKFVVAPESTKASVCTFVLYTQSVTEIFLRKIVLLHADRDQKVWSRNKDESKIREMKSPNYFTIVH